MGNRVCMKCKYYDTCGDFYRTKMCAGFELCKQEEYEKRYNLRLSCAKEMLRDVKGTLKSWGRKVDSFDNFCTQEDFAKICGFGGDNMSLSQFLCMWEESGLNDRWEMFRIFHEELNVEFQNGNLTW